MNGGLQRIRENFEEGVGDPVGSWGFIVGEAMEGSIEVMTHEDVRDERTFICRFVDMEWIEVGWASTWTKRVGDVRGRCNC